MRRSLSATRASPTTATAMWNRRITRRTTTTRFAAALVPLAVPLAQWGSESGQQSLPRVTQLGRVPGKGRMLPRVRRGRREESTYTSRTPSRNAGRKGEEEEEEEEGPLCMPRHTRLHRTPAVAPRS